ncbi:MAG: YHYH protein [Acidobacteria bacterium]|nr:YHYH protein [Acidobacteriota bacterium]
MKSKMVMLWAALGVAFGQPPGPPPGPPPGMQAGDGIWLRDALFGERDTFDSCLAHQPGQGQYHNHVQPVCLRAQLGDNIEVVATSRTGSTYREKASGWKHSPILGWALDGYPIYGPYGYSDPKSATSPIQRMRSGYRLRQMTQRDTLPDWALDYHAGVPKSLPAAQQGPPINDRFPLGRYLEDNEFVVGLGDLDQFNGRTTVTPEYPNGTYAYFITIKDDGTPAFPYILGLQYYGTVARGAATTPAPAEAQDYFANGQYSGPRNPADPTLQSWQTENATTLARAVVGWDPSAGPQTTWPGVQPAGARAPGGGVTTPAKADIQRIRTTASMVYVNSNNLPSYVIGPWFAGGMNGGVFMNFAASIDVQAALPRAPQAATGTRTNTGLGAVGIWVNGVAIFNAADGASYRNASGDDAGGGLVQANAIHWSSASLEGGPVTPGALMTAFAQFEAKLATGTEAAATANWPTTLGGATVTIVDAAEVSTPAPISYASARQVNYRIPETVATGLATVRITAGGVTVPGAIHVVSTYPGLFRANAENAAVAQVARVRGGSVVYEPVQGPVTLGPAGEQATLVLYGTGLNGAKEVTATVGGVATPVAYAGPQGRYAGLDQINVTLPAGLAGRGKVDVVVTAGGKPSNAVNLVIR